MVTYLSAQFFFSKFDLNRLFALVLWVLVLVVGVASAQNAREETLISGANEGPDRVLRRFEPGAHGRRL